MTDDTNSGSHRVAAGVEDGVAEVGDEGLKLSTAVVRSSRCSAASPGALDCAAGSVNTTGDSAGRGFSSCAKMFTWCLPVLRRDHLLSTPLDRSR